MSAVRFARRSHRWACVAFTLAFVANVAANLLLDASQETLTIAVGLAALPPLLYLLASGLYLFVLPYLRRPQPEP